MKFLLFLELIFLFVRRKKQPPEVFYEKRCSYKFYKIHRKTPAPESEACNFVKKETLAQVFLCQFCEISRNTFYTEHFCTTASEKKITLSIHLLILQNGINYSNLQEYQQSRFLIPQILGELSVLQTFSQLKYYLISFNHIVNL